MKSSKRQTICGRVFAFALVTAFSPGAGGAARTLVPEATVSTPEVGAAIVMPVHCDSAGAVYLQPPLSRISPEGRRTAVFDLAAAAGDGLTDLTPKTFAVDADGTVYQLVRTRDQRVAIIRFDRDGHYRGSTILDQRFEPQQIGVFPGDVFAIAGVTVKTGGSRPEFAPFFGLFDRSGRLIKAIDTHEGSHYPSNGPANKSPAEDNGGRPEADGNRLAAPPELGVMESNGGHVYLIRQGEKPIIFVISMSGEVERKLALETPRKNAQVSAVRLGAGQFLVEFVQPKAEANGNAAYDMVLYDEEGHVVAEYTRAPGVSGTLACTDWRGNFTFLTADDRGPALLKATVR